MAPLCIPAGKWHGKASDLGLTALCRLFCVQTSAATSKIRVHSLPESRHSFQPGLPPPTCLLWSLNPISASVLIQWHSVARERQQVVDSGFRLNLTSVPQTLLQQMVPGLSIRSVTSLCLVAGQSWETSSSFLLGVEPQVHYMPQNRERDDMAKRIYLLRVPTQLLRSAWNQLSLLVTVVPVCSTSVGLFFTVCTRSLCTLRCLAQN